MRRPGRSAKCTNPVRHDAIDGRAVDGQALVTKVHTRGLTSYGDVVVRAKVEISPERSSS